MNLKTLLPKPIKSIDELRTAAHEAAKIEHHLEILAARKQQEVDAVTKVYGGEETRLRKTLSGLLDKIESWARGHRDEFNGQSYSVDGHALKFRLGTGKLTHPDKDADAVKAILETGDEDLIRAALNVRPTLDKDGIKSLLESDDMQAQALRDLGFSIDKAETFTFAPAAIESDEAA